MVLRLVASLALVLAVALGGCGARGDDVDDASPTDTASVASRAQACTDRFVERAQAEGDDVDEEQLRRYVQATYCSRFAERGWVYEDGTLSIAAYTWAQEGGDEECVRVTDTGQETVPCEDLPEDSIIDCAPLHHVRQSEVREYVEELRRGGRQVECDDGTPLDQLGAP